MQLRDVSAERRRGQAAAIAAAAEARRKADAQRIGPFTMAQLRALTAAAMTPERFQREVAERRAREGVWDGRSRPTPAVLAAARRRRQQAAPAPAGRVARRPLVATQLPVSQGLVTTPERFRAELAARRAADVERVLRP